MQLELGFQLYSKLSGYLLLLRVAEYDFVLMTFYDYKSFLYVVFLLCICYPFMRSLEKSCSSLYIFWGIQVSCWFRLKTL